MISGSPQIIVQKSVTLILSPHDKNLPVAQ